MLIGVCALLACTGAPDLADRTGQPMVVTQYDPAVDFGAFSTFAIAPTVSFITETPDAGSLSPSDSQMVIDTVVTELEARGYQRVDKDSRPDFGVVASALVKLKVETTVYPGYWWGLPGYAAPPTFWGYPGGYYGAGWGYSSTAYKSGTLIIEIIDLRDSRGASPTDGGASDTMSPRLDVGWAGIAHGYVELDASLRPDVPAAIAQAFAQSPYLRARK